MIGQRLDSWIPIKLFTARQPYILNILTANAPISNSLALYIVMLTQKLCTQLSVSNLSIDKEMRMRVYVTLSLHYFIYIHHECTTSQWDCNLQNFYVQQTTDVFVFVFYKIYNIQDERTETKILQFNISVQDCTDSIYFRNVRR